MNKTLLHHFLDAAHRPSHLSAFIFKRGRKWLHRSWPQVFNDVAQLSSGLSELGLKKGDHIAIWGNTRMEWALADLAGLSLGAIVVPIYANNHVDDIEYILHHCEAQFLICENSALLKKWAQVDRSRLQVKQVICMDSQCQRPEFVKTLREVSEMGADLHKNQPEALSDRCHQLSPDDAATVIYTSGTTGRPKGVLLTHRQIISEVSDVFSALNCTSQDCTLSFLPYAHIFGRVEMWGSVYAGYTLAFAESIERLKHNLRDIKPTILIGVPRIFEKLHSAIVSQSEASPWKRSAFRWATDVGQKISDHKQNRTLPSFALLTQSILAKSLVLAPVQDVLGGRLRFAVSGGAPLSREVAEFFHSLGLLVLEGYGLTETTAGVILNTPFSYRFGTIGKPIGDVQVRLAPDGELMIRSDKVMKEYFKDPEATQEAFEDGFFKTGDIAQIDKQGFITITDRKKDLIKTAGGKYVAPQKLVSRLKISPYISNVHVHGDKRKYIVSLLTLDEAATTQYAKKKGLSFQNMSSLVTQKPIQDLIREIVAEANSHLASHETIKNYAILPTDFTVQSGELTPSLKVKRNVVDQNYATLIDELYGIT
ncbi:MAG: long-chain fatty acid--CoA ligase [Pseudobdellovibrionaceae bacterium]|nr:MAG: long-chain fatty acid--CoA ligase [Pseudobdellovibrionaceae bacterium]